MDSDLLAHTIEAWQPLSPTPLTAADAVEIVESMKGFFDVLRRWQAEATVTPPAAFSPCSLRTPEGLGR